jgi:hypothetical protein
VRDAGNVKVVVQWQGLAGVDPGDPAVAAAEGVFNITLDTHSVDLDGYSLDQVAVLHAASGEEVRPTRLDFPKGGHHRKGNVVFPGRDSLGNPLFAAPAGEIELAIHDIAGVEERTFRWPLSR